MILGIGSNTIAWSPEGRQIAVALPDDPGAPYPRELRIAIANLSTDHVSTVLVRFPPGTLGRPIPPGSYPSGDGLTWTSDGRHLVIETLAEGEGPSRLTGIWHVASTGGVAQLFVGTPRGVRLAAYPTETPLDNASHVDFSPDRTHMLTDPDDRFWLGAADGRRGRYLDPHLPSNCILTQVRWVAHSAAVAYVAACRRGTSMSVQARLYSLALATPRPRQLFAVLDNTPGRLDLDLAPAYRNVGRGY